jgi:hypothetical protein
MTLNTPIDVRLLARIAIDPDSACWRWTGAHDQNGYGLMRVHNAMSRVHRLSHVLFIGPIPDGYEVDHVRAHGCVHRDCLNPEHLEAVHPHVNLARSDASCATVLRTGRCHRGHEMTPENRATRDGRCRQCHRERSARRHHANRDAIAAHRRAKYAAAKDPICPKGHEKVRKTDGSLYCSPCFREAKREGFRRRAAEANA